MAFAIGRLRREARRVLRYTDDNGELRFAVRVVPRASRSQIAGEHDGVLRVRVAAPPVEGAANQELVRTLARELKVPVRAVVITSGHSSRLKQVTVSGATASALENLAKEGNEQDKEKR
ncbi:MAG TPA: DUF167 domain-containing protein [Pyrinomonadaceae bacterium]|jgi:hypothetical protein